MINWVPCMVPSAINLRSTPGSSAGSSKRRTKPHAQLVAPPQLQPTPQRQSHRGRRSGAGGGRPGPRAGAAPPARAAATAPLHDDRRAHLQQLEQPAHALASGLHCLQFQAFGYFLWRLLECVAFIYAGRLPRFDLDCDAIVREKIALHIA
jgi:hypothetical protein